MKRLSKLLVVVAATVALSGCGTLAVLGDTVCRTIVGGSVAEVGCDDLRDLVQPEVPEVPEVDAADSTI